MPILASCRADFSFLSSHIWLGHARPYMASDRDAGKYKRWIWWPWFRLWCLIMAQSSIKQSPFGASATELAKRTHMTFEDYSRALCSEDQKNMLPFGYDEQGNTVPFGHPSYFCRLETLLKTASQEPDSLEESSRSFFAEEIRQSVMGAIFLKTTPPSKFVEEATQSPFDPFQPLSAEDINRILRHIIYYYGDWFTCQKPMLELVVRLAYGFDDNGEEIKLGPSYYRRLDALYRTIKNFRGSFLGKPKVRPESDDDQRKEWKRQSLLVSIKGKRDCYSPPQFGGNWYTYLQGLSFVNFERDCPDYFKWIGSDSFKVIAPRLRPLIDLPLKVRVSKITKFLRF